MESKDSEDSHGNKKIPLEGLSKEEIVKKYRHAILIAQKAKESKAEFQKNISQHEKAIREFEEKLQKVEENRKTEADLRAKAESELQYAQGIIANLKQTGTKIHPTTELSDHGMEGNPILGFVCTGSQEMQEYGAEKHLKENPLFLSEKKLKTLEAELAELKDELNRLNNLKYKLENSIREKDDTIQSMAEQIKNENEMLQTNQSELDLKVQGLEKSLETVRRKWSDDGIAYKKKIKDLEELVYTKQQDAMEQVEGFDELRIQMGNLQEELLEKQSLAHESEKKIVELQLLVDQFEKKIQDQSNDDTISQLTERLHQLGKDIVLRDQEILSKEKAMALLLSELQTAKFDMDKLKQMMSETSSRLESLQLENNSYDQKLLLLEAQKANLCLEIEKYKNSVEEESGDHTVKNLTVENSKLEQKLLMRQEELCSKTNTITQLSTEIQVLQDNLIESKKELLESISSVDALQSENEILCQKVSTLDAEKSSIQSSLNENVERMREQRIYMSDMEGKVREAKETISNLENLLDEKNQSITQLDAQVQTLNASLQEETQNSLASAEKSVSLQKEVDKINQEMLRKDEAVAILKIELAETRTGFQSLQAEKAEIEHELVLTMETLKKEKAMKERNSEIAAVDQVIQELREQLQTVQDTLREKDSYIQDMEQEVVKLRDAVAHETTNTEVSSTFSLSRAEEFSRMKDFEDSFEDKYTKLRVVAVKLKRRVTELTQTLENERSKMAAERSELQAKLTQVAFNAKTVQTLQGEVDRLQDLLEDQKKLQLQLSKDLELAVKEAASKKYELASIQEDLLQATNDKRRLETTISNMESTLSKSDNLQGEIDRVCKELKEKEISLEILKEEKQKLSEQLDKVCAGAKKNSVLSLEMADMEKSVSELTRQLTSERDCLKQTNEKLELEHVLSLSLQNELKQLDHRFSEKDSAYRDLKEMLSSLKEEAASLKNKCQEKETALNQLSIQLEKERSQVEALNLQCSELAAKQMQASETSRQQIEALSRQIFQLEEKQFSMREVNRALEDELASVRTDFDNYKVRAQSVLRQSAKQEDRLVSSSTVHHAEELEVEVERLRLNISSLNANLKQAMSQLEGALQEVTVEREEKLHALKQVQHFKESCTQSIERQHAAEERLSVVIDESKQAKLHADTLIQCYKQQLEDLKTTHQKRISTLTEQLENLQATITNTPVASIESGQALSIQSNPSPVADWAAQISTSGHPDSDLAIRLSSLQREEGEGSESVDSFPTRRISVATQERRHELVPLDKLLSSPMYPEPDNFDVAMVVDSSDLNVELLQSKLSACESRAAHLTALLSEAESDAARLSQLNAVLKEEIRRQQRSEERTQLAHNLEYLKNIVVKFITLQNGDERQRLVPVLNTILKLSPEEANLIATVVKGSPQASSNARGWGSYLPLPGWSGS